MTDAADHRAEPGTPPTVIWPLPMAGPTRAFVDPSTGGAWTYDELAETVERLARQLAGLGVEPGDVVASAFGNGVDGVAIFLAITAARAAAAPLNPAYTVDEFAAYLTDLRPRAMLLGANDPDEARQACRQLGVTQIEVLGSGPRDLSIGARRADGERRTPQPDDVALLLHTSGTTSKPKSVPLRHRNIAASAHAIGRGYRLGPDDVSYCVMPLFHVHGLIGSTLATLHSGGTVVVAPRFSARAFWRHAADHGATWFSAVPTILGVLANHDESPRPGTRLRYARSCSASLAPSLHRSFEARFGVPLVEAYGMTEAAHQMTTNPLPPGDRRPGSVGVAAGAEMAIVDEAWRPLPAGTTGEVVVRGPGVVDGYLNAPDATATSFRDGWFRTGDSGSLSADGYLHLAGRIKELINRGGEKISPHEVEEVLLRHASVEEAVAFALPDTKYGEVVGAVVVGAAADGDLLRRHCAEQLAAFKVPARIAVMGAIPKGPTGKVQRRILPEAMGA